MYHSEQHGVFYVSLLAEPPRKPTHSAHQSGVSLVFLQHFLSEFRTERGKIPDDFGGGTRPFWIPFFLVTGDELLYIVAYVGVGGHLVQESPYASSMDPFCA